MLRPSSDSLRGVDRWRSSLPALRQATIASLVALHFALGLLATVPRRSRIWTLPVLATAGNLYSHYRLDQSWSMFAPPPQVNTTIHYAVEFPDGWTELVSLNAFAVDQVRHTLVQPRGTFRLVTFTRSSNADQLPSGLQPGGERAFYFQQLADYFCAGDGRIRGALRIRFYLVGHRAPYFFATDQFGRPQPPLRDSDFQQPLYEQACGGS
jgi:hypothetical protein